MASILSIIVYFVLSMALLAFTITLKLLPIAWKLVKLACRGIKKVFKYIVFCYALVFYDIKEYFLNKKKNIIEEYEYYVAKYSKIMNKEYGDENDIEILQMHENNEDIDYNNDFDVFNIKRIKKLNRNIILYRLDYELLPLNIYSYNWQET